MSKLLDTLGCLAGTATSIGIGYLGYLSLDTFSEQVLSGGIDYWSNGTSEGAQSSTVKADGNTPALTTVFGLISSVGGAGGSSSGGEIINIITQNKKAYSETEMRAKRIYDDYNKSHEKEKNEGTNLIINDPEIVVLVNDILNSSSKQELITKLSGLEYILNQAKNTKAEESRQYSLK